MPCGLILFCGNLQKSQNKIKNFLSGIYSKILYYNCTNVEYLIGFYKCFKLPGILQLNEQDRDLLWKALLRKYVDDCKKTGETPAKNQSEALFGYGKYDPSGPKSDKSRAPTIKRFMIEDGVLEGSKHQGFNAQYLYRKFILESPPVKIRDRDIAICLTYAGYPSDFLTFRSLFTEELEAAQSYFRGFFYSTTLAQVREFTFTCDFTHGPPYDIRQWRIHKRFEGDEDFLYTGIAERNRSHLYCRLENALQTRHLYLILYAGAGDCKNLPYLFGTFTGVSNNDEPMAGELILIKSEREKVHLFQQSKPPAPLSESAWQEGKRAEYYLMINRNHFHAPPKIPANQPSFAETCYYFDELSELAGVYAIANYTRNGNLVMSWLSISDDLSGWLRTRFDSWEEEKEVEQNCTFHLEQYQGHYYLHLFGYHEHHFHNYAVFDLNYRTRKNGKKILLPGAFCSCSNNGRPLGAQQLFAIKAGAPTVISGNPAYAPKWIKADQIDQEVSRNTQLALLLDALGPFQKDRSVD